MVLHVEKNNNTNTHNSPVCADRKIWLLMAALHKNIAGADHCIMKLLIVSFYIFLKTARTHIQDQDR